MAEIEGWLLILREGDDAAKTAAARGLGKFAWDNAANRVAIAEAGGIPPLVELLRDGSAGAKAMAARALCNLAYVNAANQAAIAEAGGIARLVDLVRSGSPVATLAAVGALGNLAAGNAANQVAIAEAGAIPVLVELLRDGSAEASRRATGALRTTAHNNDANAVAIALAVGRLEALVELARGVRVTVDNQSVVRNAGIAAKRKAALVVAALLRACVPDELRSRVDVQDVIRGVIGAYL